MALTGAEKKKLREWFQYWDRTGNAKVNAMEVCETLRTLGILVEEQCTALKSEVKSLLASHSSGKEYHKVSSMTKRVNDKNADAQDYFAGLEKELKKAEQAASEAVLEAAIAEAERLKEEKEARSKGILLGLSEQIASFDRAAETSKYAESKQFMARRIGDAHRGAQPNLNPHPWP